MCALDVFEEIRKLTGIIEVSGRLQAEGSRDPKEVNTCERSPDDNDDEQKSLWSLRKVNERGRF